RAGRRSAAMLPRMRIGMLATRLGDVDGVSFEVIKWQSVLQRLGHEVVLCAGLLPAERGPSDALIPEMHFDYHPAQRVSEAAFDRASDPAAVRAEIGRLADALFDRLSRWLDDARVEQLVVQNAWAIPMHLPLGVAVTRLARDSGVPSLGHHHDYWWERVRFASCIVPEVLDEAFPPDLPGLTHVSINSLAASELRRRRGLRSEVIPNVFDFDQLRPPDGAARAVQLRAELGLAPDDLLVVQPTRVVPRKGIELAIELVARLGRPDAVLLVTSPAGDEGYEYLLGLERLAERLGVDFRYAPERFRPDQQPGGSQELPEPTHSLVDAYIAADVITYPSLYEGFGNALVEAVFFGKPLVVNRYAVYEADIRPLGFRFVELDGGVSQAAVDQLNDLLADPRRRALDAEHNFELGRRHLSYDRLERSLEVLIGQRAGSGSASVAG
ncbi:MAG TPA: glycosyltransferase family 4 protein, partial [Candidatus Limnocylindria bacterium]|nr:glycosyltransferase family 4 protein [Candidatus Limnocylindria bacterium]